MAANKKKRVTKELRPVTNGLSLYSVTALASASILTGLLVLWKFSLSNSARFQKSNQSINPYTKCSACEASTSLVVQALLYPSPQVQQRKVSERDTQGRKKEISYAKSSAYMDFVMESVCRSSSMSHFKLKRSWLGMHTYVPDSIPNYVHHRSKSASDLQKTCAGILGSKDAQASIKTVLKQLLSQYDPDIVVALLCSRVVQACSFKEKPIEAIFILLDHILFQNFGILLQVLPLVGAILLLFTSLAPGSWKQAPCNLS